MHCCWDLWCSIVQWASTWAITTIVLSWNLLYPWVVVITRVILGVLLVNEFNSKHSSSLSSHYLSPSFHFSFSYFISYNSLLLLLLLLLLLFMLLVSRSIGLWKITCISSLCSIDKLSFPPFFDFQLPPLVPNIFFRFSNQEAMFFFFLLLSLSSYVLQWHHMKKTTSSSATFLRS